MTDYAADLLGTKAETTAAASTDYASQLLGPSERKASENQTGRTPAEPKVSKIENEDAGVTDKSTADFSTLTKASMVDDPATKLKIFAKARFPNDPKAVERYSMVDGDVVYENEGKLYREHPKGFLGWMKGAAAGTVGAPGATAGAIAGGIAGAPAGPLGAVGLGATGAGLGKLVDKGIAKVAFDEPQSAYGNLKAAAIEEGVAGVAGAVGGGVSRFLGRNVAKDISKYDRSAASDLTSKAERIGVELNPAQVTNLPSLKGKMDVLGSLPTSRDIVAEAHKKQASQAYKAADDLINSISPKSGLDEAGEVARDAAKNVIAMLAKERSDKARPLYQKAFETNVTATPELSELFTRPSMTGALRRAQRLAADEGMPLQIGKDIPARTVETGVLDAGGKALTKDMPAQSSQFTMRGLHYVKLALDDAIDSARESGIGNTGKRALVGIKQNLLGIMDNVSPEYGKAREVFAHFSPNVNAVKEGVVSRLAGLSDESIHKAADMVFKGNISPQSVGQIRDLFVKAKLEGDWNTLLSSYIRDTFETAGRGYATAGGAVTQAPKFAAAMTGNARQYRVLEKAMSPDQFQAFKDLGEVFDAIGRTAYSGAGSQTMPRQEAAAALRRESGGGVIGQAAGALSPQQLGSRVANYIAEIRMGNHAEKVAEVLTSPDGMKRLKDLKQLSPRDQKFIASVSNLFGIALAPQAQPQPQP